MVGTVGLQQIVLEFDSATGSSGSTGRNLCSEPGRGGRAYRREYQQSSDISVENSTPKEQNDNTVWSNTLMSSGNGCKWADQDVGDEVWSSPQEEFTEHLRKLGEKEHNALGDQ
eukprot:Skav206461  [mRNA]  locus=scaffold2468:96994:108696:- [translate_table: standard]